MKNLFVAFMLVIGGSLLAGHSAQSQSLELVVSKGELEDTVRPQVPSVYEYVGMEIGDIEDKSKGMAVIQQVSLQLQLKARESLYRQTGVQNGKVLLVTQAKKGDVVSVAAIAIVAKVMGHTQMQVVIPPSRDAGVPLTNYQPNTYVIGEPGSVAQAASQAAPSVAPPTVATNNSTAPAASASDALQQLMDIANRNGGVWGVQGDRSYNNTPVILKNLVLESPGVLTGVIQHPYPILENPFKLMGQAGQYTMQVITAPISSEGIRSALYPMQVKDKRLTSRGGPEFPLRAEESAAIEKDFARTLRPWKYDGKLTDYAQVFGRLINIDTLEVASDSWISVLAGPVANLDVRYWSPGLYELTTPPYGAYGASNIQTLELGQRKPIAPLRETTGDVWVSQDVGTYVRLRGGDLWKGTIDWQNNTTGKEVNLTQIGLLNKLQPIAWCGSNFYFHNFEATGKPILRINTDTGDFTELPEQKALNRNVKGSPDGRFLFASFGRFDYSESGAVNPLYVYNCRTGESFTMEAQIDERRYIGKDKVDPIPKTIEPKAWISESIFYTDIGWYDLAKRKRTLFIDMPAIVKALPYEARAYRYIQMPGGEYLDVTMDGLDRPRTDKERNPPIVEKRYRIHRDSGEAVELPIEPGIHYKGHSNLNITWVDVNRYVVSRNKGGLSEVGTWLYDIRTGKHKQLTRFFHNDRTYAENALFTSEANAQFMTPRYVTNQYLVLPQRNRIMFSTTRGQVDELISVSLDGGDPVSSQLAVTKGTNGKRLRLVYPYPVSLPLKIIPSSAGASSQPAPSSQAVPPVAADMQSNTLSSLELEGQKVKEKCFASSSMRQAYDCSCYADIYMKNRQKLGPDADEQSVRVAYQGECTNIPEFKRQQYTNCMSSSKNITNQHQQKIEQEPYCRCVSEKAGELYAGKPGKETLDGKRTSIMIAMAHCRKTGTYN